MFPYHARPTHAQAQAEAEAEAKVEVKPLVRSVGACFPLAAEIENFHVSFKCMRVRVL